MFYLKIKNVDVVFVPMNPNNVAVNIVKMYFRYVDKFPFAFIFSMKIIIFVFF